MSETSDNNNPHQHITDIQHNDFIWTWSSNKKSSRVSLWIPYLLEISKIPRSSLWRISYNGGVLEVDLKKVEFILFYGATGSLPLDFLDALSINGIICILHRRNIERPYFFFTSNLNDQYDVLSKQICVRCNEIKSTYLSRILIKERIQKMIDGYSIASTYVDDLNKARNVASVRNVEAIATRQYWKKWYESMGLDSKRREDSPINTALNVCSKFVYGVILRWVLFHKLSPCHGFLHEPTNYPSLVYDLIEPYRYIIEIATKEAYMQLFEMDEKKLISYSIENVKALLEEVVYVPVTKQYVRRKNLLHGIVLALRAYLIGESRHFIIPKEGISKGGRPPNCGYRLPGEIYKRKK